QAGRIRHRLPEAAVFPVVKLREHRVGQREREFELLRIKRGLVEINHAGEEKGIGIEELNRITFAVAPAMVKRAGGITLTQPSATFSHPMGEGWGEGRYPQLRLNKREIFFRRGAIRFITQHCV